MEIPIFLVDGLLHYLVVNGNFLTFILDDIFDRNIDQLDVRETPR